MNDVGGSGEVRVRSAAQHRPLVALATCADLPELDADSQNLAAALRARGMEVCAWVWTDRDVTWADAAIVVVRTTWDYASQRSRFLAWANGVSAQTRLCNSAALLAWSTDKHYLAELGRVGVRIVPTEFVAPGESSRQFLEVEHVVKPSVSAGSLDTWRVGAGEVVARQHAVDAIHRSGRVAMIQPYLGAVDTAGETALVYIDGEYSHCLRKGPMLAAPGARGDADVSASQAGAPLFHSESITVRRPTDDELASGAEVMEHARVAHGGLFPLYARVDLLPSHQGPMLLELELAEPSLFFDVVPEAADTLAAAIAAQLEPKSA